MGEEEAANNKLINDTQRNQQMTDEDILKLRNSGLSAEELAERLSANNANFDKKTAYSKAKYMKRKKQKFSRYFTAVKPTAISMCRMFGEKNNHKILNMREDSLAMLLNLANVSAGGRYLVVDDTQALITAAIMERTGVNCEIVSIYSDKFPNLDCLRYLSLSEEESAKVKALHWSYLRSDVPSLFEIVGSPKVYERIKEARAALDIADFDGYIPYPCHILFLTFCRLIVASKLHPTPIVKALMPYVGLASPVVVYSGSIEPLSDTYNYMRSSAECINVQMMDYWCREYQVFPNRFHPQNNTRAASGFLLATLKVEKLADEDAVDDGAEDGNEKKRPRIEGQEPAMEEELALQ